MDVEIQLLTEQINRKEAAAAEGHFALHILVELGRSGWLEVGILFEVFAACKIILYGSKRLGSSRHLQGSYIGLGYMHIHICICVQ